MYAFVRFIKIVNLDLLVSNLCTIWHGKLRLHANVSRFPRGAKPSIHVNGTKQVGSMHAYNPKPMGDVHANNANTRNFGKPKTRGDGVSYADAVTGDRNTVLNATNDEPALVLDNSCLNLHDQSHTLIAKVKEFGSLVKLLDVVAKDGFVDVVVRYMGGLGILGIQGFQNER